MLKWRGLDASTLGATFIREGATTSKRALRHMRRVTKLVMDQSVANSPVDWKGPGGRGSPPGHELEKSHHIVEQYGVGGRIESTIEVGGMVGNVDVDLYAEWAHEGVYNLGPASIAKQAANPKAHVGPHFLDNAIRDHEDDFEELLDELLEGLMTL